MALPIISGQAALFFWPAPREEYNFFVDIFYSLEHLKSIIEFYYPLFQDWQN